jgi:hypothetical protein
MKRHAFVRGLLTATTVATGLFLLGSTPASADTVRPPVFGKVKITCHDDGSAGVVTKLTNPNTTMQHYMVGIHAGDIYYDYVVMPAANGSEVVEFGGLPNDTYVLQAQGEDAEVVASIQVRVQCDATPTSGPSSPATAVPSTPVAVPTAVEAGLPGVVAQDDSIPGGTIVGGLLAAAGIIVGLASLLLRRRRGQHHL